MPLRKRIFLRVVGALAALVLLAGIAAIFVVQSDWFYDKVRQRIIGTVETATGGRVELGSFRFDWQHMLAGIAAIFVVESAWFYDKVRQRIIGTVETATGGRVELGSFRFDWQHMRAEMHEFVLHGTE